jgi:hypothetical protein
VPTHHRHHHHGSESGDSAGGTIAPTPRPAVDD